MALVKNIAKILGPFHRARKEEGRGAFSPSCGLSFLSPRHARNIRELAELRAPLMRAALMNRACEERARAANPSRTDHLLRLFLRGTFIFFFSFFLFLFALPSKTHYFGATDENRNAERNEEP